MKITVLGKSPSWQDAGGACSGYLVQHDGFTLIIDCGSGVFGRLREHVDYVDVDAVLITHLHADHFLDLVPYAYALTYSPRQQPVPVAGYPGTDTPARPALHAPEGSVGVFDTITAVWGSPRLITGAFRVREYDPAQTMQVGPFSVRLQLVPHYLPTYAVDLTTAEGTRFTFGADSAPCDEIVRFAEGTDLLLLESTLPRPERDGVRGHMTPSEAAVLADRAGAARLVLTHISDELDADWALGEAKGAYGGPVEMAVSGATYEV